jgi:hypothetical protein
LNEPFLALNRIEHRRSELSAPEPQRFCKDFRCTVKEEFYSVAFREAFYRSLIQLYANLDRNPEFNNRKRAYQGYR